MAEKTKSQNESNSVKEPLPKSAFIERATRFVQTQITTPTQVRGVAIGVVLAIVFGLAVKFDQLFPLFLVLLAGVVLIALVAFIVNRVLERQIAYARDEGMSLLSFCSSHIDIATKLLKVYLEKAGIKPDDKEVKESLHSGLQQFERMSRIAFIFLVRIYAMGILLTALGSAITFALFLATYQQNALIENQNTLIKNQNDLSVTQNTLAEASRRSSLMIEMSSILDQLDKIASSKSENVVRVPRHTVGRIQALSRSLRPYRYVDDNGQLTQSVWSPERGQLLLSLISYPIEESLLDRINLDYADLTRSNLNAEQLQRIHAENANFSNSILTDTDFSFAYLRGSNFSNATMKRTVFLGEPDLRNCDFRDADLRYADLAHAHVRNSDFRGADLRNAFVGQPDWWTYWELEIDDSEWSIELCRDFREHMLPRSIAARLDSHEEVKATWREIGRDSSKMEDFRHKLQSIGLEFWVLKANYPDKWPAPNLFEASERVVSPDDTKGLRRITE